MSFSSSRIPILVLIALTINGVLSVVVSELRSSNCTPQPKEPIENVTFAITDDKTAGVRIDSYIEVNFNNVSGFVPLKLNGLKQFGHPYGHHDATLELIMDCAILQLTLNVTMKGEEYNGTAIEARLTHEGEESVMKNPPLSFKKYLYRGYAGYVMSWDNLEFVSNGLAKKIVIRQFGFVMESNDVRYKYNNNIRNEVGFQGNWF